MAKRVLSTPEAEAAIKKIQSIIQGGLATELGNLDREGKTLSQPNVWDGPLAETFRNNTWPTTDTALKQAKTKLEELQQQLDKIAKDIQAAGGN